MLSSSQIFFLSLGCISSLFLILTCLKSFIFSRQQFFARAPITPFEAKMFRRLKIAFPDHHILAQVAFSALITSDHYKVRHKFNRKVTDFVILNDALDVIAIIELDDPSHLEKVKEDQLRDQMFKEAGYSIFRYTDIPNIRQLHRDIL
ncbi:MULTISPECIES: DUF2726 domain-containing protein [unclassified Acinetobacter]|uniref:DUF2726 domain-containing protein n=1 Tax=unclassified Acinetobacter TaxID=196816 RepID=UPI00190B7F6E|nr:MULTISPECIES: DUF2726 domain-containing protein [unclassified Acinetobacter]MBK0063868.1 DUF2726 domain-containing protein [Acinetobacter sp. S55]MBK0067064.1 DUF2726 domain-containing protein [Acinetobacter sp. S54]